jgi:hypothetical protein
MNGALAVPPLTSCTFSKVIAVEPELPAVSDMVGGDAVSVNVGGGGAYAGERKRAPIIVNTRIERIETAMNLNPRTISSRNQHTLSRS